MILELLASQPSHPHPTARSTLPTLLESTPQDLSIALCHYPKSHTCVLAKALHRAFAHHEGHSHCRRSCALVGVQSGVTLSVLADENSVDTARSVAPLMLAAPIRYLDQDLAKLDKRTSTPPLLRLLDDGRERMASALDRGGGQNVGPSSPSETLSTQLSLSVPSHTAQPEVSTALSLSMPGAEAPLTRPAQRPFNTASAALSTPRPIRLVTQEDAVALRLQGLPLYPGRNAVAGKAPAGSTLSGSSERRLPRGTGSSQRASEPFTLSVGVFAPRRPANPIMEVARDALTQLFRVSAASTSRQSSDPASHALDLAPANMQREHKATPEQGTRDAPSSEASLARAAPADTATASTSTRTPHRTAEQKERRNLLGRLQRQERKDAAAAGDQDALDELAWIKQKRQEATRKYEQSLTPEAKARRYEKQKLRFERLQEEAQSGDTDVARNAEDALQRYRLGKAKANKRRNDRKRRARQDAAAAGTS